MSVRIPPLRPFQALLRRLLPLLVLVLAALSGTAFAGPKPASGQIVPVGTHVGVVAPQNAALHLGVWQTAVPPPSGVTIAPNTGAGGTGSTIAQNAAAGAKAEDAVEAGISSQPGLQYQPRVTLTDGTTRSVADGAISGPANATVQIPQGFVAEDLNGNPLVDANGNQITSFQLNGQGQAIVEVKTGGATLTGNQATIYPQVQSGGSVAGRGSNANNANLLPPAGTNLPSIPVFVLRQQ